MVVLQGSFCRRGIVEGARCFLGDAQPGPPGVYFDDLSSFAWSQCCHFIISVNSLIIDLIYVIACARQWIWQMIVVSVVGRAARGLHRNEIMVGTFQPYGIRIRHSNSRATD